MLHLKGQVPLRRLLALEVQKTFYAFDFYIKIKQHDGSLKKFVIEVKPKKQCSAPPTQPKRKTKKWFNEVKTWGINEAKWKYATEWCNNNDMEFKILTEDHLNIRYK